MLGSFSEFCSKRRVEIDRLKAVLGLGQQTGSQPQTAGKKRRRRTRRNKRRLKKKTRKNKNYRRRR